MEDMAGTILKLGILGAVMALVMYLMYINGWMLLSSKTAVSFIGARGAKAASFTGCSGSIKRILRVPRDGVYTFTLDAALTKGEMTVSLLSPDKEALLCLSAEQPQMAVALEKHKRYRLVLRFCSASGRYGLQWN